ncbi:phosphoethanolamine transferase [Porphyromonas gingivalis]|uniref:Sulfatase N-terminal domain-containing protein n=2 Tax=Porphyromonas TaxID=836 RepID=B2RKD7_PORG3|nr:phosphoethanolamine transferase [Porphyromonas gingivalis]AIJ35584.1 arylsulfatase [Porphyromonas gingivalis]ALJ25754.1 putative membrane-associated, metal-dependent hydrolase [Porphyromonas gingivalis 381]AUR49196.1 phosphoethanolamine transferase [Porphyromonas gingivalis ATCC 33277]MDR4975111.1 phosphoethanolamine transferase [Porphyromonas gingivalis]PDP67227.1 arylsulfatase [Porphyromonas gingivalis]
MIDLFSKLRNSDCSLRQNASNTYVHRLLSRSYLLFFLAFLQLIVNESYRRVLVSWNMEVRFADILIAPIVWSLVVYLLLAAIPSRRLYRGIMWPVILIATLMYVVEMYLLRCYGTVFIPYIATAFLATTSAEASAFWREAFSWSDIGHVAGWYAIVWLVSLTLGRLLHLLPSRPKFLFPLLLLFLSPILYAAVWHYPKALDQLSEDRGYAFSYPTAAPCERLVWSISQSLMEGKEINALFDRINSSTKRDMVTKVSPKAPHTVVLVLGESARPDYMHSYGYPLENTPRLDSLLASGAAVQFDDVVSAKPNTQGSIAAMMSIGESRAGGKWYDDPMLIPLLRSAGYYTFWLSAQEKLGFAVQNVTAIAKLSDSTLFVFRGMDDVVLPNLMQRAEYQNLFEVVHLSGSHVSYQDRYPSEFGKFTSENLPSHHDESKDAVVAHYVNSLYYTDYILGEIERKYANEDAIIIYLSDHGQVLYDAPNNPNLVGHSFSQQGVSIPLFIYLSPSMRAKYPELIPRLQSIRSRRIMTDVLPYAIMGLLGIESPLYNPELDFWGTGYDEHRPRVIYTDDSSLVID